MPVISVGKPLREKLGDAGVDSLLDLINQSTSELKTDVLKFVEQKFERRLSDEIGKLRTEFVTISSETKTELIKWMFIFWVGQMGVMLGFLFAFVK
ncbi:MAG: LA_3696 family protein [bacterium]